jgi:hypothetical protein
VLGCIRWAHTLQKSRKIKREREKGKRKKKKREKERGKRGKERYTNKCPGHYRKKWYKVQRDSIKGRNPSHLLLRHFLLLRCRRTYLKMSKFKREGREGRERGGGEGGGIIGDGERERVGREREKGYSSKDSSSPNRLVRHIGAIPRRPRRVINIIIEFS